MIERPLTPNRYLLPETSQKSINIPGGFGNKVITIPIQPELTGFNFGFWFYPVKGNNNIGLLEWKGASTNGFRLKSGTVGSAFPLAFLVGNGVNETGFNYSAFPLNKWSHITGTYDGTTIKGYVNAVYNNQGTRTMSDPGSQSFYLGNEDGNVAFNGNFYRFTLHNRVTPWDQDEIDDIVYRNIIPEGAYQWSMNDTNLDINGENALTLSGTSYASLAPFPPRPVRSV